MNRKSVFISLFIVGLVLLSGLNFLRLSATATDFKDEVHDVAVTKITAPSSNDTFYMQPGTIPIAGIIQNLGTYDESNLICTATITNGYAESISDIDLVIGQEETLVFTNATLDIEGTYYLTISLPLENDSDPSDNEKTMQICVDATPPVVSFWLDPPVPNGCNGWYTVPVTFGFNTTEECEIYYSLDNGSWILYTEPVTIYTSGIHVLRYYVIDKFGNQGPEQLIIIRIDREPPVVIYHKQILCNWIKFWAEVYDNISGVSAVGFYILNQLQFNDTEAPWEFVLHPIPLGNYNLTIVAYDGACNKGSSNATVLPFPQQGYHNLHGFLLMLQLVWKSYHDLRDTLN